jgi:hypothetical protein
MTKPALINVNDIAKSVKSDHGFYDRFRDQIKTYSQMGQIKHDQNKPIWLYVTPRRFIASQMPRVLTPRRWARS